MSSKSPQILNVDYVTYFKLCDELSKRIKQEIRKAPLWRVYGDCRFDQIVAIARGGLIVGTYLAYKLELPIFAVYARSYQDMQRGELKITIPHMPLKGKETLLIDDVYDSGTTILAVKHSLNKKGSVVCPATLYRKRETGFFLIDEFAKYTKRWINFWYEEAL